MMSEYQITRLRREKFVLLYSRGSNLEIHGTYQLSVTAMIEVTTQILFFVDWMILLLVIVYYCQFEYRYLVDVKWMKQWKKYVGYDQSEQKYAGLEAAHPGPVDNATLLRAWG